MCVIDKIEQMYYTILWIIERGIHVQKLFFIGALIASTLLPAAANASSGSGTDARSVTISRTSAAAFCKAWRSDAENRVDRLIGTVAVNEVGAAIVDRAIGAELENERFCRQLDIEHTITGLRPERK